MDRTTVMTMMDSIRHPLVLLARDLRVMHANCAFGTLVGVEDGRGRTMAQLNASLFGASALAEALAAALDSGEPLEAYRLAEGGEGIVVDGRRIDLGDGALLVSIEDRSESEALRKLRRYQTLLHASLEHAVFSMDNRFTVRSWNRAAEELLGFGAAEVVGKLSSSVLAFETERSRMHARELLESGQTFKAEGRIRRKDGVYIDVYSATVPIRDETGTPIGYACVMHDISENKRLERELRQHASALEAANEELDSFCYSVSHDLRTPLRAIDGFSRVIEEEHGPSMSSDARQLFEKIRRNAQRMAHLIDDLLEFSRLGRRAMRESVVDMNALVEYAIEENIESDRVVELRVGELPPACGDSSLLGQVWSNLIGNAVKYTRHSEHAVVTISGRRTETETIYSISDNGVGFDMRYVGHLFGVFSRLHSNDRFEGTGVGLALVKRILERHGGTIHADAVEGQGATFTFQLPSPREASIATRP